jgi:hypothetical protein
VKRDHDRRLSSACGEIEVADQPDAAMLGIGNGRLHRDLVLRG